MDLNEAIEKYKIDVPNDEVFYSEKYKEYFKENSKEYDLEFEKYRPFDEMYKKSFLVTFGEKIDKNMGNANRVAVVLGGQSGAGKTSLVNLTSREAMLKNNSFYVIDDDQYRKFYPKYNDIMAECPEYSTILTAIGSGPITPKILKYASDNGLNFIFDGTMKNTRIIETAKQWENYDTHFRVMATSRIESLISIFERNAYLRRLGFGLPVGIDAHDETYNGLELTVSTVEATYPDNIEIFMRSKSKTGMPELIYSSKQKGIYQNAVEALKSGRNRDKQRCMQSDIYERISNLEGLSIMLTTKEKEEILLLKETLRKEINELELT